MHHYYGPPIILLVSWAMLAGLIFIRSRSWSSSNRSVANLLTAILLIVLLFTVVIQVIAFVAGG